MSLKTLLTILIVYSVGSLASASADDGIVIGTHQYAPYVVGREDHSIDGISVRQVKELFCRANVSYSLKLRPWTRAYNEASLGRVDAIFPIFKNSEREKLLTYSRLPLGEQINVLVVRNGYEQLTQTPEDLSDLKHFSVDYVKSFSLGSKLDSLKGIAIPDDGDSLTPERAITKLVGGRFDVLLIDQLSLNYMAEKLHLADRLTVLEPPVEKIPYYIAFSKERALNGYLRKVNEELEQMSSDGSVSRIINEYFTGQPGSFGCSD